MARAGLAVFTALLLLALLPALPADAAKDDAARLTADGLVRLDSVHAGALLLKSDTPGWYVPAPTLKTKVDVAVSGPLARTKVTQQFRNVAEVFVDGTYVFPLTEGAAVDTLRMRVGDRWVEGRIEGREEAREIFEEAAAAGQVASLVEQQRPNVFTTSVANIAPGADVIVQIEYQQTLVPSNGIFGLRIPLVVAPRYVPASQVAPHLLLSPDGWIVDPWLEAEAAAELAPLSDRGSETVDVDSPVAISIDLDAGFPLGDTRSVYHDVEIDRRHESGATIDLTRPVGTQRDFYLSWRPIELDQAYAATFREHRENETHFVTLLTSPAQESIGDTRPAREVIFVQDTSGSMQGESIMQARAGLLMALESLSEQDTFNIIEFNSLFTRFRPEPVKATTANITHATRFVNRLIADNGTEMHKALKAALDDSTPDDGRLRQVIFLTDGAVSNEREMLTLIESDLGSSRLFTVGIGAAPNSYFMTAAARAGRGSFVFIGQLDEVGERMEQLFAKIETPAIVDLAIEGLPDGAEVTPWPLPDLYAGDPVALTVRVPSFTEGQTIKLVGTRGDSDWQMDIPLGDAPPRPGVSKLWAREQIRDLEALWIAPDIDAQGREEIDDMIRTTALDFGLVSRHTSLVAVDVEITRPPNDDNADDNAEDSFFGDSFDIETADGDLSGVEALSTAAIDHLNARAIDVDNGANGVPLPATGAGWRARVLLGAALALGGSAVLRRREPSHG